MRTDLNLLRVLLAVHEEGNVTAAAKALGISQPAASAALGRLRRSLDDPLFVRSGSSMTATARALGIIEKTREVIGIIDRDILAAPIFDPRSSTTEFVICLSQIGELLFLPRLYEVMRREAPNCRIRTIHLSPQDLSDQLRDGLVDIAIGYFPDLAASNVFQQRLYGHDLVCLLRRGHPATTEALTMDVFLSLEHLQVRDGSRSQEMFEKFLAENKIKRKIKLQTSHYMSVGAILECSDLAVVVPRIMSQMYSELWAVSLVELPASFPSYDVKQYWHARTHKNPHHVWLRHQVRQLFAESL